MQYAQNMVRLIRRSNASPEAAACVIWCRETVRKDIAEEEESC